MQSYENFNTIKTKRRKGASDVPQCSVVLYQQCTVLNVSAVESLDEPSCPT